MFNIFATRVTVVSGDPLKAEAEALVIPANDHLWMGAGLAGTVKKSGGEEIEVEAVRQGPAALGQAVATGAGALAMRRLYHAVLAGQDLKIHADQIRPAVVAALKAAAADGIQRVAIAPLESEELAGAFHAAASEVVAALLEALSTPRSVGQVLLLTTHEESDRAYREALHAALRGPGA